MRLYSNLAVSVRRPHGHRTVSVRPPYDFWKILRSPCGDRTVTVRSPHDHRRVGLNNFKNKNRAMSAANVIINIAARRPLRWVKKSQMKKSYGDRTMTVANVIQALHNLLDPVRLENKMWGALLDNGADFLWKSTLRQGKIVFDQLNTDRDKVFSVVVTQHFWDTRNTQILCTYLF